MTGEVYAVASGKGGVGKTTTVTNTGIALRARGRSVALVDADLGMPNLATFLGRDPETSIHDVLAGEASVGDVVVEEAEGFAILPGSDELSGFAAADPAELSGVVEALAEDYEFVLVDTGAGLGYEDVLPLGMADGVILVTSPDPAALGDTERTARIAGLVDVPLRGVVVTRADGSTDPAGIADGLGTELLGTIPDDPTVPESTAAGRPLEVYAPDSAAAEAYRRVAAVLAGEPIEGSPATIPEPVDRGESGTGEPAADDGDDAAAEEAREGEGEAGPDGEDGDPADGEVRDVDGEAEPAGAGEDGASEDPGEGADGTDTSDGEDGGVLSRLVRRLR